MNRKMIIIFLILMFPLFLVACEKKTIEKQEKVDEISNTKEISDNMIIIDSKPTDSKVNKPVNNIDNSNQGITINDEQIPAKSVETITIIPNPTSVRYYEGLIKDDSIKLETYKSISEAIKNRQKKAIIPITEDSSYISEIYEFVRLDHPEYFYIPVKFKVLTTKINNIVSAMEVELIYDDSTWNPSKINIYKKEIEDSAKNILAKAKSIDGDYNKVLYIYNYITQNIDYESDSPDDYSIYGALINKKATCEGYSESLQYLLNALEIDTITVVGTSKEQPHQWNMINIDGLWYYFDATWDSPINSDKYLPYTYFAITLENIKKTHVLANESILPPSVNNKYNYYYYNDLILYSYDEKSLLNISKKSLEFNPQHIAFRVENDDIYNMVINDISQWIPKILNVLKIDVGQISYVFNEELNVIDIFLKEE